MKLKGAGSLTTGFSSNSWPAFAILYALNYANTTRAYNAIHNMYYTHATGMLRDGHDLLWFTSSSVAAYVRNFWIAVTNCTHKINRAYKGGMSPCLQLNCQSVLASLLNMR